MIIHRCPKLSYTTLVKGHPGNHDLKCHRHAPSGNHTVISDKSGWSSHMRLSNNELILCQFSLYNSNDKLENGTRLYVYKTREEMIPPADFLDEWCWNQFCWDEWCMMIYQGIVKSNIMPKLSEEWIHIRPTGTEEYKENRRWICIFAINFLMRHRLDMLITAYCMQIA